MCFCLILKEQLRAYWLPQRALLFYLNQYTKATIIWTFFQHFFNVFCILSKAVFLLVSFGQPLYTTPFSTQLQPFFDIIFLFFAKAFTCLKTNFSILYIIEIYFLLHIISHCLFKRLSNLNHAVKHVFRTRKYRSCGIFYNYINNAVLSVWYADITTQSW